MINRKCEKHIKEWINNSKKALLVSGARQVGKTFSIRRCLKEMKCNYLEINLIDQPDLLTVIESSRSVDDLVINLSAATNFSFIKGETILFIDEVQEAKDVVTRIKFWVDEGSFRYVLSGSLLGVELRYLRSAPVGYIEEIKMFPLDFEEFLLASKVQPEVINHLHECFYKEESVGEIIHNKMMEHFRRYLVVGGMPDAVQEYISSNNISKVTAIQSNIIEMYKRDFTKYERDDKKLMIISVYDLMPSQLLKHNRRFNFSDLKKGLKFTRLENSFIWLISAGVAIPAYNTTEPRVSLIQNKKSSLVKLYLSDVGLLTSTFGNALRAKLLVSDQKVNLGGIYENAVAQELNTHGFQPYFYNSHKNGELDFLIEEAASVIPIEVKSGKDYYVHSALSKTVSNKEYGVEKAYVLTNYDMRREGKIVYLPVYMCMFIKDDAVFPTLVQL